MRRTFRMIVALLAVLTLSVGAAFADQPSLDELLDLAPPPRKEAPGEEPATPAETSEMEALRAKRLAEYDQAANAFESAVSEMGDVADRLIQSHDPDLDTQRVQERIIKKMDQMIAAAKKMQGSGSSSSSSGSRQQDSGTQQMTQQSQAGQRDASDPGKTSEPGVATSSSKPNISSDTQKPIEELQREWGNLPPRLRDELSEGLNETFSPLYRRMTRAYYERLAEESGE